jgi:hypothetical protein
MTIANRAVLVTGANRGITQVPAPNTGLIFPIFLCRNRLPSLVIPIEAA